MTDFSSILNHPDRDEIISKLLTGTDAKDVNQWLKLRYPNKDQNHLRLSIKILQDFGKSQYTDFYNQYTQDITAAVHSGQIDKLDKKVADSLLNNKTLRERLAEHTSKEIDIKERFLMLDLIIRDRIEQMFDKIQENPGGAKADYAILKWIEQYLNLLDKYDKQVNNRPDQVIQHTHTIQYFNQQIAAYQDAMREVLATYDPDMAIFLQEKITEKLNNVKRPPELLQQDVNERFIEVEQMTSRIKNEE
jgi:hypothetical protein